jgi:AcrR family transcriptional regulator
VVRKSNSRSIADTEAAAPPRQARRRDARRDGILKAAATIFRTRGFAGAGMREIADQAGLSPANLYHYFRGKDEILFYCQDRALDRMLAGIASVRRRPIPVPERLRLVLASHVRVMLDEVEGATAHLQTDALSPALRARIVRKRDRYERALRALIAAGVARKECLAPDPALAARAMLGALNWTVTWFNPNGPRTAAAVGDDIANFLVRGVRSQS